MFEMLKALMALNEACRETEHHMWWGIAPGDNVLRVEIQVTDEDREFVEQAREMFEPRT